MLRRVSGDRLGVALGPLELAGTARALADGLRQLDHRPRVLTWDAHPLGYRSDGVVTGRRARARFAWSAPRDFDVLHGQGGRTWFSYVDFAWARARGTTCVIQYNGSETRTSDVAARLHPRRARIVDASRDRNIRRHRRLGALVAHAAVVQDLELATYLLAAYRTIYVAPFAIDLEGIERARSAARASSSRGRLLVLHAPSNRFIKASVTIEATVRSLEDELGLELETISGVSHAEVLAAAARADIVIDQLNAEVPGVFPAEAMALGKPVICEYDPRKLAPFARPCPVLPATAETLAARLHELAADASRRDDIGAAGREYATSVHAPLAAAKAIERVYRHAPAGQRGVFEATAEGVRQIDLAAELPELAAPPGAAATVPLPQ